MELLTQPHMWVALATLTILELVLGIDNIIFISILVSKLPKAKHQHYEQAEVGHYGVFNGSRWRKFIQPKVAEFMAANRAQVKG